MEKTLEPGTGSTLIDLKGLSKVFDTEEVETHALSDIQLETKARLLRMCPRLRPPDRGRH